MQNSYRLRTSAVCVLSSLKDLFKFVKKKKSIKNPCNIKRLLKNYFDKYLLELSALCVLVVQRVNAFETKF